MMAALLIVVVWLTVRSMFNILPPICPQRGAAPSSATFKPTATPTPGLPGRQPWLIGQRQIVLRPGSPTGLVLVGAEACMLIDAVHAHILKYDRGGRPVMQWGSAGSGDGQFQFIRPNTTGGYP
jgi:hypothetical protein